MSANAKSIFADILREHENELLEAWLKQQQLLTRRQKELIGENELRDRCRQFLQLLRQAATRAPGLSRAVELELLELLTPVVKLWKGIPALPLIGILDSAGTQVVRSFSSMVENIDACVTFRRFD